jgi:hypothetical protein
MRVRRLVVAGGIVLGLFLLGAGLVVANLRRIVEANHDRIVAEISAGFARPVRVERFDVGFHGGIGMELEKFAVADDPAFSKEDFLTADAVRVVVRLWPLLHGQVVVRRIVLESPRITVIRRNTGANVDSIGRPTPSGAAAAAAPSTRGGGMGAPAIAVVLMSMHDGDVRFVDETGAKPVERRVAPIDLEVSDLGPTTVMQTDLSATLAGDAPTTLHVHGRIGPVGDPPFAADVPLDVRVGVHGPAVETTGVIITGSAHRDAAGRMAGRLQVHGSTLRAGAVTATDFSADAVEKDGVATLERLVVHVFDGAVEGHGQLDHRAEPPAAQLDGTFRGLDVEQLLAAGNPGAPARVRGRLDANGSVSASLGDGPTVRHTLQANGHGEVHDGAIVDVNLVDGVLSGVSGIGGMVTLVPQKLRDRYADVFDATDTRFDQLSADLRVSNERVRMDSVLMKARDYTVRGQGTATFAQQIDFTATLTPSDRLTADVLGSVKEARYLTDDAGHLSIPFHLVGTLPNVRARPDEQFLARVVRKLFAGETVDKLGGGKGADGKGSDPAGKLLRKLDKFLGR